MDITERSVMQFEPLPNDQCKPGDHAMSGLTASGACRRRDEGGYAAILVAAARIAPS